MGCNERNMGCNERGKSSSSISNVDHHKIKKKSFKSFKNRILGFEKKFYELRTLCDVKATAVVYSEFMNGVKALPVNPREFDEVVMLKKFYDQKKMKSKNRRFCFGISTVQSLQMIERDLESKFNMISKRENQLKAGSSSSLNCCYQDDEIKKNLGAFKSTNCESTSLVVRSVSEHGSSSSSDLHQQQQPQPLITLDPAGLITTTAADNMFCDYEPKFADLIELEFQRLNCSSSYMDMMMNPTNPIDGPEFLLC